MANAKRETKQSAPSNEFNELLVQVDAARTHVLEQLTAVVSRPMNAAAVSLAQGVTNAMTGHLAELGSRVRGWLESHRRLDEQFPIACIERAWYVSNRVDRARAHLMVDYHRKRQYADADRVIVEYVRTRTPELRNKLSELWPDRAAIIVDAFDAHDEGRYSLSIPSLLAQADGINKEICDRYLLGSSNARGKSAGAVENWRARGEVALRMFPLVSEYGLLSALYPMNDRIETWRDKIHDPRFARLNRHAVAHGEQCDYATDDNSWRCVAIILFLADLVTLRASAVNVPALLAGMKYFVDRAEARAHEADSTDDLPLMNP